MAPILLALAPLMTGLGATAATGTAAAAGGLASTSILGSIAAAAGWAGSHAALLTSLGAGGLAAGGTLYAGVKAKQNADLEAKAMKQKGDDEFAIGQRRSMQRRQETNLLLSRERAVVAAGGGDTTDQSVTAIMGKTQQVGDYNAMMDMYNGTTMRNDLYNSARSRGAEGVSSMVGSTINAGTSIYSAFSRRRNSYYQ